VILLLLLVGVQTLSGLFLSGGDLFVVEAPLSGWVGGRMTRWLGDVHEWGFTVLQAVVALHIVAALAYAVLKRRNLIVPMLTGRDADLQGPAPFMAPLSRAIVLGALVAAGVWALVRFA
jgi:cytochrome b